MDIEQGCKGIANDGSHVTEDSKSHVTEDSKPERKLYDWRKFAPSKKNLVSYVEWLVNGTSAQSKQSDRELQENLSSLARMLFLLREYEDRFGMPEVGGSSDQEYVLRQVSKVLYTGGAPIWALRPVMTQVAEGLTGKQGVDFFFLPYKAFVYFPSSGNTSIFEWRRGFCISLLDAMEHVAVRLASFASNTPSVSSLRSRTPLPSELHEAFRSAVEVYEREHYSYSPEELAMKILDLASDAAGLFYFANSNWTSLDSQAFFSGDVVPTQPQSETVETFPKYALWTVKDSTRELFSRLAAVEAIKSIDRIGADKKVLYPPWLIISFRIASSASCCAIWFDGYWYDMVASGVLAAVVSYIRTSKFLSVSKPVLVDIVACYVVGLAAGMIAFKWPEQTCFGAMSIAAVLDLLQGFKVVYAVIELMSKHPVMGGADFLEAVLLSGVIAFSLTFGEHTALLIMNQDPYAFEFPECTNGINNWWYFLFVPLAALSWSGLFHPNYVDLPWMGFHGTLAVTVSYWMDRATDNDNLSNFVAAITLMLSAGIVSRFTGRTAVGNSVAGLFALVPGVYLVRHAFSSSHENFFGSVVLSCVILGLGAWTGTLLCSQTFIGTNIGLLEQTNRRQERAEQKGRSGALLFF